MRSSLTLLAALGAALALAGPGGGAPSDRGASASGDGPEPGVALRVAATDPRAVGPELLERFAIASGSAAVTGAVRQVARGLAREGIDIDRDLLAPLAWLSISLERSCPPPAVLACRPATRVCARLRAAPSARFRRQVHAAVVAGLRAGGFGAVVPTQASAPGLEGRVTSKRETLARWRLDGDVLEVASGGLGLHGCAGVEPPGAVVERPGAALEIERDPQELALLLDDHR